MGQIFTIKQLAEMDGGRGSEFSFNARMERPMTRRCACFQPVQHCRSHMSECTQGLSRNYVHRVCKGATKVSRDECPFRRVHLAQLIVCAISLLPAVACADFSPILLTSGSFNQDIVVEKSAPPPAAPGAYTTASMDQGNGNFGFTWYELDYDNGFPPTGIPPAGGTFTHQNASDHHYAMAPDYRSNNAAVLDPGISTATLT